MPDRDEPDKLPLPKQWPRHARAAVLNAISLAASAFVLHLERWTNRLPLRDVLTRGCHPVGACHYRGSPRRDTSHAAEAVVNKLNEDDARVAALVTPGRDFGYSHDLHTASPPSRYSYSGFLTSAPRNGATPYREPTLPNELRDQLRALGKEVYFVRDLGFRELFKIAWERLKFGWTTAVARSMLLKRFTQMSRRFDGLRRLFKSKDASVKLHKRDEVETLDLGPGCQ